MPLSNAQPVVAAPSDGTVLLGIPPRPLTSGHRLRDYELKDVVARGACAAVYAAWDHALQREVALQEYLPADLGRRGAGDQALAAAVPRLQDALDAGRKGFLAEARQLARFDHPSLAKVYRFFEEDGTAYMVMPLYPGPTLRTALAALGRVPDEGELRAWLRPVLDALSVLHDAGQWHGHVSPDNILLTPMGPVLLGPALAEHAIAQALQHPASALVPGYAAPEQYGDPDATQLATQYGTPYAAEHATASAAEHDSEPKDAAAPTGDHAEVDPRGPWTDLYALAAVVRAAITGEEPQPADKRLADDRMRPLRAIAAGLYRPGFLAALDAALAVDPQARPRDHHAWRAMLGDIAAPQRVQLVPERDLMLEPFDGARADDGIITVPGRAPSLAPAPEPAAPAAPPAPPAPRPAPRPAPQTTADPVPRPQAHVVGAPPMTTSVNLPPEGAASGSSRRAAARPDAAGDPAWTARRGDGQRSLVYGIVAAAFAAIGLIALGWQMIERGKGAGPARTPTTAPMSATTPVTRPQVPAPAPAGPATATPPAAQPAAQPVTPTVASAVVPAVQAPPAVAPGASVAGSAPASAAPLTAAERHSRCLDILQRASLESITPADQAFYTKECR